jgi:hypothetical protein
LLLRDASLPTIVKLTLLIAVLTAILLLSCRLFVRYAWIGRILNGPRVRPQRMIR